MWRQIENTNYEVSNDGLIRNSMSKTIICGGISTSGYRMASLYCNGKRKNIQVHREVAKAFIENQDNKSQVNHIDGNKLNNRISNLEWVTPKENMKHAFETGLYKKFNNQVYKGKFGKDHNRSIKITINGTLYHGYSEASRITGIKMSTIYHAIKYKHKLRNGTVIEKA